MLPYFAVALLAGAQGAKLPGEYIVKKEVDRSFIVLGAAGAGKSTFINALTHTDSADVDGKTVCPSAGSCTLNVHLRESGRIRTPSLEGEIKLKFLDTIGLDANDTATSDDLFTDLVRQAGTQMNNVNGIIVIHKMERFRAGFARELESMFRLFQIFDLTPSHVMLLITHSAIYTDEIQNNYAKDLIKHLGSPLLTLKNTHHVNFVTFAHIRPEFTPYFEALWEKDFNRILRVFYQASQSFSPLEVFFKDSLVMEKVKEKFSDPKSAGIGQAGRAIYGYIFSG